MPESPSRIRVLIVDDHPVVRMGLVAMVNGEADMVVAAEAATGGEALAAFERDRPDVTIMDLELPDKNGAQVIKEMLALDAQARVLVLTTYDSEEDVFRAIQAGARGFLLKRTFRGGVLEAIRTVHAGQRVIPSDVAGRLADRLVAPNFTKRECEILELVAKGLTNKEIGAVLSLAEETIKSRLKAIFTKLDVSDRTEAIVVAMQKGLIRRE